MSIQINSSEVLKHLNNYGITSVDDEALKLFIKDLKKLIKYELRKNSENSSSESNEFHSPQKLNTFMPAQSRSSSPSKRSHRRCAKKEIPNVYPLVLCRCEPYLCEKIVNCNCHHEKRVQPNDRENISAHAKTSKSPDIPCASKLTNEKTIESKSTKGKEPAEQIFRPASSTSHTRSHSGGRTKKLCRDPVELYQYYQSIWKKHTLPGENDHAQLRRSIRDRLMKVK